jgi:biopolymer transport protein TolR
MGASIKATHQATGRRRRGRKHAPMSEINVTPMVDVMLVLLIIFMVAAPLLTVGVPVDLPDAKGHQLEAKKQEPLIISVKPNGDIYIGEAPVPLDEVPVKLKAIAKNGTDESIYVRGDKGVSYGVVLRLIGRIVEGGFKKVSFISEPEKSGG